MVSEHTIKLIKNIKEEDLVYFGERIEPYFASNLIISGMVDNASVKKIFGFETAVRWFQLNYYFWQLRGDLVAMESELKDSLKKQGVSYIESLIKNCIKAGKKLLVISKEKGEKAKNISEKENLAKELEEFFLAGKAYTTYYTLANFERPTLEIAEKIVKKYSKSEDEKRDLFELVTTSSRETVVEEEQEDFLRRASGDPNQRAELAKKHADKYGWLSIRFYLGEPWTSEDILKRLETVDRNVAKGELDKRLRERRLREQRISDAVQIFSDQDKEVVNQIRGIVFLRNQRADYYNEASFHIRSLLQKIADVLGVTYPDMMNLCASEIILALKGRFDFKKHIERRKKGFIIFHAGDDSIVLEDEEVTTCLREKPFLKMEVVKDKEIIGRTGYKGKVTGSVRIVHLAEDIEKVRKGDILVTAMTIPNFMPAMEKAAAFVTDEGGVTCHAAIVAREMHKPCIIGTKIATKVLKDGDMVEVDANKGVVKIIKRA